MIEFAPLEEFLNRVPAIVGPVGKGANQDGTWWVKFAINVDHTLAWKIVQDPQFLPAKCAGWLEGRLPKPVDDLVQWQDEGVDG